MRILTTYILLLCGMSAFAQPTLQDTTRFTVFDPTKQWDATGADLKTFIGSGGSVATDAIWDAAGDLVVGSGANTAVRLAMGTASQQIRVNAGGTALEYFTPSAGSGDITNGGNTTGATVTIGTNDANALNLETNNVARVAITGGASTGGAMTLTNVTANTNTVQNALTVQSNSSGTAAAGFGAGLLFQGESSTTDNQDMARISSYWTTATHASREAAISFQTGDAAGAIAEIMKLDRVAESTGNLSIGSSTPVAITRAAITPTMSFSITNPTQSVTISSGSASAGAVSITSTDNTTTSTGSIIFGQSSALVQESGTRSYIRHRTSFSPTSGNAVHNKFLFDGTINQTGGANGIVRCINIAHTMTAAADYRAIEIADNLANAHGIYQTGALTKNVFVGKTTHGATTTPTALLMLAAGTASANTAPLKLTSGTNLTTPENGAVEYDGTDYYVTSGGTRYTLAKVLKGSATLDFGATLAGAATELTITVTGAASGDVVSLGVDLATVSVANGGFTAYVSAANTVTVRYTNNDLTNAYNPTSATFKVTVTK